MNGFVAELVRILNHPVEEGRVDVDWGQVEEVSGVSFPTDFKDFVACLGAGLIDDYVSVSAPDPDNTSIDLIGKSENFVETLRGVRETLPEELSAYPLRSRVGGIIMWGANEDGDLCFWIAEPGDPDQWRVGVYNRNFNDWREYPCGFAEFLVGVLTREIESPFSRADFPPESSSFKTWRVYLDELLDED